jgi:hypothetical protein
MRLPGFPFSAEQPFRAGFVADSRRDARGTLREQGLLDRLRRIFCVNKRDHSSIAVGSGVCLFQPDAAAPDQRTKSIAAAVPDFNRGQPHFPSIHEVERAAIADRGHFRIFDDGKSARLVGHCDTGHSTGADRHNECHTQLRFH